MRVRVSPMAVARPDESFVGALCLVDAVVTHAPDPAWALEAGSGVSESAMGALLRRWRWSAELWESGALERAGSLRELASLVLEEMEHLEQASGAGRAMRLLASGAGRSEAEVARVMVDTLSSGKGPMWVEVGMALAGGRSARDAGPLQLGVSGSVAGKVKRSMERVVWTGQVAGVCLTDGDLVARWRTLMQGPRDTVNGALDELTGVVERVEGPEEEAAVAAEALVPAVREWEDAWRDVAETLREEEGGAVRFRGFSASVVAAPTGAEREATVRASRALEKSPPTRPEERGIGRVEAGLRVRVLPWDV
jgi:hypothetical protein